MEDIKINSSHHLNALTIQNEPLIIFIAIVISQYSYTSMYCEWVGQHVVGIVQ